MRTQVTIANNELSSLKLSILGKGVKPNGRNKKVSYRDAKVSERPIIHQGKYD